ncbi:MAG TPA: hypothetical protein PLS45_02315 [Bacillota bacterium]|nr:hypothetical protein [Bacillota bacterium]HNU79848.1 hypothetical protein [Bacillota bacterium]HPL98715.1 hypothetical protein [Bacillota bacterium]HPW41775.1 hypothetical protein [Bacillota bacterium]HRU42585.1 hypothetical protein [Candidatus Diapherotrites archaeon]
MINSIKGSPAVNQNYEAKEKHDNRQVENTKAKEDQAVILDLSKPVKKSAGYSKPAARKIDVDEIDRLWKESQKSYETLRKLVEKLISKQGKKLEDLLEGKDVLLVDEETRAAAAQAVSEDGELGVKAVSERIVAFAKAVSGDDKSRIGELKNAIIQGFKEAEKALGGTLPDISQRTYDEVMKKLDEWSEE